MGDWMISRKRIYGLSLPFYECAECGNLTVVGSKEELKEMAVNPSVVDGLESLHRPWIDEVEIKCPHCGKPVKRVLDVGDCWLDAGVVPFSTLKYLNDKEYWKKWYPGNFATEMIEQVRLWFYSMLVFGVVLDGTVPYQNVLTFGELRDENNDKMSKSKPNYIPFDEAADKGGSDLIRWNFAVSPITKNVRFGWNTLDDVKKRFYFPLWNSYVYWVTYAKMHNWEAREFNPDVLENVLDKWIVNRLHVVIDDVAKYMDEYDIASASRLLENFVQDMSTWYIRRSRTRFVGGDRKALDTLHFVLLNLVKVLAPMVPFITEEMYQNLAVNIDYPQSKESVHLEDYPCFDWNVDTSLLEEMDKVRTVASLGLKVRVDAGLRLRQPLQKAVVDIKDRELRDLLLSELNVKEVEFASDLPASDGWRSEQSNKGSVAIYTVVDEVLKKEGWFNDIRRAVQNARKRGGAKVGEMVNVQCWTENDVVSVFLSDNIQKLQSDLAVVIEIVNEAPDVKPDKVGEYKFACVVTSS
jgi:isoleucyl-tRNA synthetase